jgi:nicotinamidase-related amidase
VSDTPKRTALLIIDVQAGIFDGSSDLDTPVLERIRALLGAAHAAGTPVIYVQHDGPDGDPLAPEEPGWMIHPAVAQGASELVVRKRASDAFYKTSLNRELQARGITHLVVAGANTEFCVDTTCRAALSRGYEVLLAADAHLPGECERAAAEATIAHHNAVLAYLPHPDHRILVQPVEAIAFAPAS